MSASVNLQIICGRVGFCEVKPSKDGGMLIARISIATEDYAGKGKEPVTTWHNCKAFGKTAELIQRFVTKGTLVHVVGSARYDKVEGGKGVYASVMVDRIQFLAKLKEKDAADGPPDLGGDDDGPPDLGGDVPF